MMGRQHYGGVKEIVVAADRMIWVTAEEKNKMEMGGEVKISNENKDFSDGWLVLTERSEKPNAGR